MSKKLVIGALLLLLAVAGFWFFLQQPEPVSPSEHTPPPVVLAPAVAPPPTAPPEIRHVIEPLAPDAAPVLPALPALADSDTMAAEALAEVFGAKSFARFFHIQNLVRRIVVTVDNLPRAKLPRSLLPVKPPGGAFLVTGAGATLAIAPENAARYVAYIRLADHVDSARLVAVYRRLYPLFQSAYDELGYSGAYFNDRLVEVIDHLLATAPVTEPVSLVQPKIFYEFAAPELESLSAGRKLLLRIGKADTERVKIKLRELRSGIVAVQAQEKK